MKKNCNLPEEELDEIAAAKYNSLSEEEKMKWEGGHATFGPPPTKEASSGDDQSEDSSTSEYVNPGASGTSDQPIDLLNDSDNSEEDHEKSDGENEDAAQDEEHVEEDGLDEEMEGVGEEDVDVVPSTWTQGREVSRRLSHLAIVKGKQGKPFAFALLPYLLSFT